LPCLKGLTSPLAPWSLHTDVLAVTSLEVHQHCGDNTLIQLLSSGFWWTHSTVCQLFC